jgi:hypothetical protein
MVARLVSMLLAAAGYRRSSTRARADSSPVVSRCTALTQAEEFIEGSALLSMVGIWFDHLTWTTEKKVPNLMCDNCGLIQWFGAGPRKR